MKLRELKISLAQMEVIPGRPDLNADFVIKEIASAAKRGINLIVFPELCVSGYLLGDKYEDIGFIEDVSKHNERIVSSTPSNITAIFGSIVSSSNKGEDG